ncbi:MAG: hypothetical protein ACSHX0_05825 [Akkermansiaceae bacterium]
MSDSSILRLSRLRQVTTILLDSRLSASSLRPEVLELVQILNDSNEDKFIHDEEIASGETLTSGGLALSPTMAAMCAVDSVRTVTFLRGIQHAVMAVRKKCQDRPARILYVGSGPFGTLAVPLMTVFDESEALFTLLDIHPDSIRSVNAIVNNLHLDQSVSGITATDALRYSIEPGKPPDIIIIETMQACLVSEPQVAITRHLLQQAPNAILVPQEVCIDLQLVDPSREFNLASPQGDVAPLNRDRVPLGPVFVVNRQTISSWSSTVSDVIPGCTTHISEAWDERYQPMLCTTICVYQDQVLKDYDSGLTCPRSLTIEGKVHPGDTLHCSYLLGSNPRLDFQRLNESESSIPSDSP